MTRHLRELESRRLELVARSAAQRVAIAGAAAPFVVKLAALDRIRATVRKHPVAVAAVACGVAAFGSRSLMLWATRALAVYALIRRV
jgi:hypothetical protein